MPYWPPRQCKLAEKAVRLLSEVISEVPPGVNLGPGRRAGSAKLARGRISEMTPEGRCTVFSAGLHCLGGQYVFTGNAQNHQKVPKMGVPPFLTVFYRKAAEIWTPFSKIFEKKCGFFPLGHSLGGEPHFFRKSAKTGSRFLLPSQNRVF